MNVLVLTSEPISAEQLRGALPDADPSERTEVLVVAPALHESALRFWLSDADEAIAKAEAVSTRRSIALERRASPRTATRGRAIPSRPSR
ncbi:MAG: hypothetical protein ACXVQR_01040, partial [Solirubrobacteraceae bacterium]